MSGSLLFIEGIFTFSDVIIVDLQLRREGKYAQEEATDRILHVRDLKKDIGRLQTEEPAGVPVPSIDHTKSIVIFESRKKCNEYD